MSAVLNLRVPCAMELGAAAAAAAAAAATAAAAAAAAATVVVAISLKRTMKYLGLAKRPL